MIVTRLYGGLGNQMFQYAIGRVLSLKCHTDLFLDLTTLTNPPPNITRRYFELDNFNIDANIASVDLLKRIPRSYKDILLNEIQIFLKRKNIFQFVKEHTVNFDSEILGLTDNVYLDGYWQSEKYFAGISDVIRKDFSFLQNPSDGIRNILDAIQGCNSVSIHIRRGDFVTNPEIRKIHFVCDDQYYQNAVEIIIKNVEKPHFFVFSDDIHYVHDHILIDAPVTYINQKTGFKSYEDMRLMTHCHHHIIANSSFSWWGAWLGKKEGQVVVAPNRWFNEKPCNYDDRLPSAWLIVK